MPSVCCGKSESSKLAATGVGTTQPVQENGFVSPGYANLGVYGTNANPVICAQELQSANAMHPLYPRWRSPIDKMAFVKTGLVKIAVPTRRAGSSGIPIPAQDNRNQVSSSNDKVQSHAGPWP